MTDERDLIERWFVDLFSEGDLDVADEILADDITYHGPESVSPRAAKTPADVKRYVRKYHDTFPDFRYEIQSVFGEGDRLCVEWTAEGTQENDLFGIQGSGEQFHDEGLNAFRFEDGRIAEIWSYWDTLGMVQQLGIISPLGLAAAQKD
jgi:steroid delta-isomerase-like uncharacterized protein